MSHHPKSNPASLRVSGILCLSLTLVSQGLSADDRIACHALDRVREAYQAKSAQPGESMAVVAMASMAIPRMGGRFNELLLEEATNLGNQKIEAIENAIAEAIKHEVGRPAVNITSIKRKLEIATAYSGHTAEKQYLPVNEEAAKNYLSEGLQNVFHPERQEWSDAVRKEIIERYQYTGMDLGLTRGSADGFEKEARKSLARGGFSERDTEFVIRHLKSLSKEDLDVVVDVAFDEKNRKNVFSKIVSNEIARPIAKRLVIEHYKTEVVAQARKNVLRTFSGVRAFAAKEGKQLCKKIFTGSNLGWAVFGILTDPEMIHAAESDFSSLLDLRSEESCRILTLKGANPEDQKRLRQQILAVDEALRIRHQKNFLAKREAESGDIEEGAYCPVPEANEESGRDSLKALPVQFHGVTPGQRGAASRIQ